MKTQHPSSETNLDKAPALRAARWEDVNAVAQYIYSVCEAEGDTSVAVTPEDLVNEWKFEGFHPEQDAFLLETNAGCLTGYAALYDNGEHCHLTGDIYIHPVLTGAAGIRTLLGALEVRAREHVQLAPPGRRVFIRLQLDNKDEADKAFIVQAGYVPVRYHWRMGVELDAAPQATSLPAGLEFRPFLREEHGEAVWQARNEAFKEHWGSRALTFDEFTYYNFDNPEYDPTLWRVLWQGMNVAGFCINRYRMGIGWVQILGVSPAWRGKGLGLALLYDSFAEFYRRGTRSIGLGVDASNPTGATHLYQKVGMHIVNEFVSLEKELRAPV